MRTIRCRWRAVAVTAACVAPLAACPGAFYDAATAIAYDIESHTARHTRAGTSTLVHVPKSGRGGCKDAYKVQFSRAAGLVVWCWAAGSTTQAVSSHATTYHLRFVDVPETIIVDKQRGESLAIEVARAAGKPAITAVR